MVTKPQDSTVSRVQRGGVVIKEAIFAQKIRDKPADGNDTKDTTQMYV
jgi:hypothetical protein